METMAASKSPGPGLDPTLEKAWKFLQCLSDRRPTRVVLDFLATEPDLPLWIQDQETGWSVLHFAVEQEDVHLLRRFIEAGAPWNLIDNLGRTAGELALSLNNAACYELIREAGLRSGIPVHLRSSL